MTEDWIGFDRTIRLRWLDQTALLAAELRDGEALRQGLLDRLAGDVRGETGRRKTVTVLGRIWWRVPEAHIPLRDEALALVAQEPPDVRLARHWGMALLAYPLFRDVTTTVGRLLRLQGSFKVAQLSQRIGAQWGTRTTLQYAVVRILRSLADWGVLQPAGEIGSYGAAAPGASLLGEPGLWLLEASLRARGINVPLNDLPRSPELFPFTIAAAPGHLIQSKRFQVDRQGQDLLMVHVAQAT